jgi:hypothetical protein
MHNARLGFRPGIKVRGKVTPRAYFIVTALSNTALPSTASQNENKRVVVVACLLKKKKRASSKRIKGVPREPPQWGRDRGADRLRMQAEKIGPAKESVVQAPDPTPTRDLLMNPTPVP